MFMRILFRTIPFNVLIRYYYLNLEQCDNLCSPNGGNYSHTHTHTPPPPPHPPTPTFWKSMNLDLCVSRWKRARLLHTGLRQMVGRAYLNCCGTSLITPWQSMHRKVPLTWGRGGGRGAGSGSGHNGPCACVCVGVCTCACACSPARGARGASGPPGR